MAKKKNGCNGEETLVEENLQVPARPAHHAPLGLEDMDREDLVIPRLVLIQAMSQIENGVAGQFHLNLTGEQFDEVEVVFLKLTKGRVMYNPNEIGEKPLCGSSDRIVPSARFESPMSERCDGCEYAIHNKGERFTACAKNYSLLGVFTDTQMPFWWTVKASALWPTQKLLTQFAVGGHDLFSARIKMSTLLITKPGKKYHVPVYSDLVWMSEDEVTQFAILFRRYAGETPDKTFEAEEGSSSEAFSWESGEEI